MSHEPSLEHRSPGANPPAPATADSPSADAHAPPEPFIPLRKADLRALVLNDPVFTSRQREQFRQLCQQLEATLHHAYHEQLEHLKECYAPFDPDIDCLPRSRPGPQERQQLARKFVAAFGRILKGANYRHLTHEELTASLDQASRLGFNMEVDFHIFERLEIFARGQSSVLKPLPGLYHRWRGQTLQVPVFQRLVVLFRLKPEYVKELGKQSDIIYIKIFKDIPCSDVDMLLPGTRVKMTWFDQGKIILPTLSGVAFTVYKIVMGALKVAFAGVYGLLAVLGVLAGTLGYASRSFYNYLNTRDKYHLNLTRNLYYLNLDSNAGVIYRLLDEAEEQDFRELLVAYYLLWKHALSDGWTIAQLDHAAEAFLAEHVQKRVDFEIADALARLAALKLIAPAADGKWRAVPLETALLQLDHQWDGQFTPGQNVHEVGWWSLPQFFHPRSDEPAEPLPGQG